MAKPKPYHHGALRPALLRAVGELLAEKGIEGLSLRECARRAGASWSAPAHHFGDKTGMLTAFAAEGFTQLTASMEQRGQGIAAPKERVAAVGLGYVEFALRNPGHFRIMFRAELLHRDDADYQATGGAAFAVLEDAIRACDAAAGVTDGANFQERCLLAWSAVHGFATLCLEGAINPPGRSAKLRLQANLAMGERVVLLLAPAILNSAGPT